MIHFGTAGWRGIVGDEFTFRNVRLVSQAIAAYLAETDGERPIVIGYDTRFLSEKFAAEAAKVLSHNGIRTLCCGRDTPTPTISFAIRQRQAGGGLNFTASHNPPEYNGLKFSDSSGAPALPEVTAAIERHLRAIEIDFDDDYYADEDRIEMIEPAAAYLDHLADLVDLELIASSGIRLVIDSLYGTGREYLDRILMDAGIPCTLIHNFRDPYFGGASPESSEDNLGELRQALEIGAGDLGLATDNDCDRFAVLDTDGTYLNPNDVLGLIAHYILTDRGPRGDLGRTVATTHLLDRIATLHGVELRETPVGFKYIGELLAKQKIVFGGEESAGLSIAGHLPEKDGILAGLLVAELAARFGTPLQQHLESMWSKVGRSIHARRNLELSDSLRDRLEQLRAEPPSHLGDRAVTAVTTIDGIKLQTGDAWFLARCSGTEAVLRCYAESPTLEETRRLHDHGRRLLLGELATTEEADATD